MSFLRWGVLAWGLLWAGWAPAGEGREVEERPPNIVFILIDDQGYYDLGCYGASEVKTPRIDAMAKTLCAICLFPSGFSRDPGSQC